MFPKLSLQLPRFGYLRAAILVLTSLALLGLGSIPALAEYGGSTINTSQPASNSLSFSSSSSPNSSTINLKYAAAGDDIVVTFDNPTNSIKEVRFESVAEINNAIILITEIDINNLFTGLPYTPLRGYAITLSNITYEQIKNLEFSFIYQNNQQINNFKAYSSNSPWLEASLAGPTSSTLGPVFQVRTTKAFKQLALTSDTPRNPNQPSVLGANDVIGTAIDTIANATNLVRTGAGQTSFYLGLFSISAFLVLSFYLIKKTNR